MEKFNETTRNFAVVATGNQYNYTDTGLTEDTSYKYRVRARDSHGFGNYSSELSLSTLMGNIGSMYGVTSSGYVRANGFTLASGSSEYSLDGTNIWETLKTNVGEG